MSVPDRRDSRCAVLQANLTNSSHRSYLAEHLFRRKSVRRWHGVFTLCFQNKCAVLSLRQLRLCVNVDMCRRQSARCAPTHSYVIASTGPRKQRQNRPRRTEDAQTTDRSKWHAKDEYAHRLAKPDEPEPADQLDESQDTLVRSRDDVSDERSGVVLGLARAASSSRG